MVTNAYLKFAIQCWPDPVKMVDTSYSTPSRITLLVIGVLSTIVGILILCKIPVLSQLGTSGGVGFTVSGVLLSIIGLCLKYQKKSTFIHVQDDDKIAIMFNSGAEKDSFIVPMSRCEWVSIYSSTEYWPYSMPEHKDPKEQAKLRKLFVNYVSASQEEFLNINLDNIISVPDKETLKLIAYRL